MSKTNRKEPNKKLITKLKNKYRLVVLNDDSFEEKISLRLSPLNLFILIGVALIVWVGIVISFVAFTPLREFIPGYADVSLRRNALLAVLKADSLEHELMLKDRYLFNIGHILDGKIPPESIGGRSDSAQNYEKINIKKSKEDSILRTQIESEDRYALAWNEDKTRKSISSFFFFTPINGIITNSFNSNEEHYGIDIAADENEAIKATLDGTVIFASWTTDNGYVMQVQHENDLVSVYKHNSVLLKKVGDYLKAGEAIAIIGNSGELTTGPHLHFELWYNGIPLNPQDYIIF